MTHEEELVINQGFIKDLDPSVQYAYTQWMMECWQKLWFFRITSGRRTLLEQTKLYGQGRWLPGPKVTWTIQGSAHLKGIAVDVFLTGGQVYQQMEDLGQKYGITRPLKNIGDLGHFEAINPIQPPQPDPQPPLTVQLDGLKKQLARTTDPQRKTMIQRTIKHILDILHITP